MIQSDLDILALDAHRVRLDRFERGQLHGGAGAHVEPGAVPRALDLIAFQLALIEGPAIVEEPDSTTYVPPGFLATEDMTSWLILERE